MASLSSSSSSYSHPHSLPPAQHSASSTAAYTGDIKVQNVVATVNLNCKIDQRLLTQKARNAEYNPKRFAAVIMRIREPKSTALIFSSGKIVVLGTKSEDDSRIAARKYSKIIKMCEHPNVKFKDFKINNMVGVAKCDFPIRLEGLVLSHAKFSSYEPELFPGLIYRLAKPKLVLLIFVSGKVVMTGGRTRQDMKVAFEKMYPVLCEHKKEKLSTLPMPPGHAKAEHGGKGKGKTLALTAGPSGHMRL